MNKEITGPRSFSGAIRQNLIRCEKLSVINCQLTDCEIPEMDRRLLIKDIFFDISQTAKLKSPNDLSKRGPGPFSFFI